MEIEFFLEKFETLIYSEKGIQKLREIVLQFAISGKLVVQDPSDEPATILLEHIKKQKVSILGKSQPKIILQSEKLPVLPFNWVYTTLQEIGVINPRNNCLDGDITGFIPMSFISEKYGVYPIFEKKQWGEIKKGYTHFSDNDVGVAKITPCFENSKSCVFKNLPNGIGSGTTELYIFRDITKSIVPEYVWIWLKSPAFILGGKHAMTGTAGQKRLSKDYFSLKPIPLPPFKEQQRIVAKVNELLEFCDQLEVKQKKQKTLKLRAVDSILHHLTDTKTTFFDQLFNIFNKKFNTLFDVLESMKNLRTSILQLAIQGKLVPQMQNEESASQLLNKVDAEKNKLAEKGVIRSSRELNVLTEHEAPYNLPLGWEFARLERFTTIKGGKRLPIGEVLTKQNTGYVYIRVSDMENGTIKDTDLHYLTENAYKKIARYTIGRDDIYFTIVGATIGKLGLIPDKFHNMNLTENAACITPYLVNKYYLFHAMNSFFCQSQFIDKTKQVGVQKIALSRLKTTIIPIPPLLEQKRIVAKIDELMSICDQLEREISNVKEISNHLMDAFVNSFAETV